MSSITPTLLNDTFRLVQLAHETALAQGKQVQAERLSPIVKDLYNLVSMAQDSGALAVQQVSTPAKTGSKGENQAGIMAQNDFHTMLTAVQNKSAQQAESANLNPSEKVQIVKAMAAGNTSEIDIARQMGMTRDEVRMILDIGLKTRPPKEVL